MQAAARRGLPRAWLASPVVRLLLLFVLATSLSSPAWASRGVRTPHVRVDLVAETLHPALGRALALAFDIRPSVGWHIYWMQPGGAGLPPQAAWTLPPGVTAGPLRHPTPSLFTLQGVASNVHAGRVVLLDALAVAQGTAVGAPLPVKVALTWLVCSVGECVPEHADLDLHLSVGDGKADGSSRRLFAKARSALPEALPAPVRYTMSGRRLSIHLPIVPPADMTSARAFLLEEGVADPAVAQTVARDGGGLVIDLQAGAPPPAGRINGVLRIDRAGGQAVGYAFSADADAALQQARSQTPPAPPVRVAGVVTFVAAFIGAMAGGLLLNLMPCVFPILSLKTLALARSGGDEAEARREAIGYLLGAVVVLTALGGVLLMLRAGGSTAGWAFQLQSPRVVVVLLLLSLGIALNLAGLFELPSVGGNVATGGGVFGGAAMGALAAFVATPCTGPFMAGALGAALLLPPPAALAVFAGLGLGLALPFLAIGFIPPLRGLMPRPGAWMQTLRRLLSVPMFATALGLAWVLGRQAGVTAMTVGLAAAMLLGLGLWWTGVLQARGRAAWPAFAALAVAAGLALVPLRTTVATASGGAGPLGAQAYSASRLDALQAAHRRVFVYLTADWCLSCKVNEATSLSSPEVVKAFAAANVAVLEGDWTRANPEVSRLLAKRHRAGVPLYLFYRSGGSERELPQVLTPAMLVDLTRQV